MPVSTTTLHWASSSLPLFVKTVWADGHRHVVLRHEDPLAHSVTNPPKSRSRLSSSCSLKSAKSSSKTERINSQNFKVQTVKLLLSGNSKKSEEIKGCFPYKEPISNEPVTVNVTPNQRIKTRNLNNEIHFWNNQLLCRKLPNYFSKNEPKNLTGYGPVHPDMDALASTIKYDPIYANNPDTLSERVMVWLDLAHSGNVGGAASTQNDARRVSTARVCDTPKIQHLEEKSEENWRDESMNRTSPKPEDGRQEVNNGEDSILKSPRLENDIFVVDKQKSAGKGRFVSPRREGKSPNSQSPRAKSAKGREVLRRELHIFLPVLPKKSSDCGSSTLSSKSSSLLIKT